MISIGVPTDSIRCDRAAIERFKFMLRNFVGDALATNSQQHLSRARPHGEHSECAEQRAPGDSVMTQS